MNKKNLQKNNGITVCDSIIMSVREKRFNLRQIEAVTVAVIGYISAIMSFLGMFEFNFSRKLFILSAVVFSSFYIILSLAGKKMMWLIITSVAGAFAVAYKYIDKLIMGYKYTYNVIYRTSMHKEIDYYKFLNAEYETESTTALFLVGAWLLAIIIYVFTIYHPNSLPPLLVTFPLIEIGLYNGIELSVFWGMLVVAYWLAVFAMTAIDMGEYSGGNGGFVRKDNTFFPKRQMKLKVTEKCGVYIIITVIAVTGLSYAFLKVTDYKRSEEINKKRVEIRDAINSFSADDLAGSISQITSAFGFTFKVQVHKLGNIDRMKYKDTTDMIVTLDHKYDGALYLKEYTGSVYRDNQWLTLDDSAYNENVFRDFNSYGIYPQDFPHIFNGGINSFSSVLTEDYQININSKLRKNRSFAPYGTDSLGILSYDFDMNVTSKSGDEYSYRFTPVNAEDIARKLQMPYTFICNTNDFADKNMTDLLSEYCSGKNILDENGNITLTSDFFVYDAEEVLAKLIGADYQDFVYKHYLQIPDTDAIKEVQQEFSGLLTTGDNAQTKIQTLTVLRDKVSTMAEYSLSPGRTPNTRDFVNYFLLENHKGYCTHYATTGVLLARMAGIPARYATGYVLVGDDFNDSTQNADGSYTIELKDNRSHAWIEVYLDGYGWTPFEFTAGYTNQTIDTTPTTATTVSSTSTETTVAESTEDSETTTERNSHTTTHSTTQTETDVVTETTFVTSESGVSHVRVIRIPKAVSYTIYTLLYALLAVLVIYLYRCIMLYVRNSHFTKGSTKSRMKYIYRYAEKLLKYLKSEQNDMNYKDFADFIEKSFSRKYFNENEFSDFMDIALKSTFSELSPDKAEVERCRKFVLEFARKIYDKSNIIQKIYLKIIIIII